ncbi:N-acetylneuraminate synthase family protein [Nanoarchaeota archaeon]
MNKIRIGNKQVGDGEPCFIVMEAGPTIYDFESGKKLCKAAAEAGADAIKFQIMDVDRLMGEKDVEFTYGTAEGPVTERLFDILKRRELPFDQWKKLKEYCDELGIQFFSTAFFPEEVDFLKVIDCRTCLHDNKTRFSIADLFVSNPNFIHK